ALVGLGVGLRDRALQERQQREGEEAVRDGDLVGRELCRAVGVDVDELVVARRVGEQVDLLLLDLVRGAWPVDLADLSLEALERDLRLAGHSGSPLVWLRPLYTTGKLARCPTSTPRPAAS